MIINKIFSARGYFKVVAWDLVYDYEDDFSSLLNVPVNTIGKLHFKIRRKFFHLVNRWGLSGLLQRVDSLFHRGSKKTLVFTLYPVKYFCNEVRSDKVPYIIDFDYNVDLENFYRVYANCKLVIIATNVAYQYLLQQECPLNIRHVPLFLSSRYKLSRKPFSDKIYDAVIVRQNDFLINSLRKYAEEHPSFEYIERVWEGGEVYKCNAYYSNKKGRLGEFTDREAFLNLLKNSKVALYNTPGFNDNRNQFMNHVTFSILEFISCGCRIISQYKVNADSEYFKLNEIIPNVKDYEEFSAMMDKYLSDASVDYLDDYEKYLLTVNTESAFEKFKKVIGQN